jgi:magnesium transporter
MLAPSAGLESTMKNPLLLPELREMLADNRVAEIRGFSEATPPDVAAEFVAALDAPEQRELLLMLEDPARAEMFAYLEDDGKIAVLEGLEKDTAAELMGAMPAELRTAFLERISDDDQARVRAVLERAPPAEAEALLQSLEEVQQEPEKPPPEEMTADEIASEIADHLNAYAFVGGRVERAPRLTKGCWVNVVNPTKDNLPLIAEHFKIPIDFLTASLDVDETARVEVDDGATLFIVKVPYFEEQADILYITIPIGIIVTNGVIITVCPREQSVLQSFIDNKVRNIAGGHRFILQLMLRATVLYLQHLKQLNNAANIIQKKLERESRNKQLIKLFNIEKSLVYFTTSLKSNMLMLERLKRLRGFDHSEENEELLEDIATECKQAIEMANIYSDILSGMMDAFASVISNNLNIVMRLLTSITIVLTIPVLIASFFGMNVPVPLAGWRYSFAAIVATSLVLCGGAVAYMRRKRWLDR